MTPQELKNSILQRAIQGKLVGQRSEEGTAEELYQQIQAEKQALIKAGKIKKEKPLPEITEEEKPFDIPESWKWVRIGEIAESNIGLTYKPSDIVENGGTLVLRSSNIQNNAMSYQDNVFVSCPIPESSKIEKGDLLICARNGSRSLVGKCAIVDRNGCAFGAFMAKIRSPFVPYIKYFLDSPVFRSQLDGVKTETINQITQSNLKKQIIPLPPIAEQKRIVAKIEELLPLIDRYEKAWSRLEEFNKRFPGDMQKSLLQMAIQGKLVEQRPEEGTGEELFRQIQAEKQALIKAGKIKKDKLLPVITDDEKPFDIPESWEWVRIGEISVVRSSKRVFENEYVSDGVPFFRSKEIGDLYRGETIKTELYISEAHYERLADEYGAPAAGDILITSVGTIGNTWICDGRKFYYKDGNITQICSSILFDSKYIERFLHSPLFEQQALSTVAGTAYSALTIIKLKNLVMPLPPLAEQKRIVAKLEELLPLCERMK